MIIPDLAFFDKVFYANLVKRFDKPMIRPMEFIMHYKNVIDILIIDIMQN